MHEKEEGTFASIFVNCPAVAIILSACLVWGL